MHTVLLYQESGLPAVPVSVPLQPAPVNERSHPTQHLSRSLKTNKPLLTSLNLHDDNLTDLIYKMKVRNSKSKRSQVSQDVLHLQLPLLRHILRQAYFTHNPLSCQRMTSFLRHGRRDSIKSLHFTPVQYFYLIIQIHVKSVSRCICPLSFN